ncbi:MAG: hypothetical protein E7302_18170 [Butyrivibrio sp.]|nr:hypothetical protein [Butyrivibrio sp.]
MREEYEYLSDEELQALIDECEDGNMVSAPLGFSDNVLQMIAETENKKTISFEQKVKEYRRFRFQVSIAVAAAILFLVVSPFISAEGIGTGASSATIGELGKSKVLTEVFGNHSIDKRLNEKDLFNLTEGE